MSAHALPEIDKDGATEARLDHIDSLVTGPVRNAVRQHAPLPTLTRTIDFGDFGEIELEIAYDAGPGTRDCFDTPATDSWFHIAAVYKPDDPTREDFLPALTRLFGEKAIEEVADFIAPAEVR